MLDEISQTPTREVEAVLAAVDACPGGSLWVLGDARQSQPVGPGGMADHIEQLAASGRIPSARLTVNRRQVDPTDRQALDLLRRGEVAGSQQLRTEHGWEHEHASPARPAGPWPPRSATTSTLTARQRWRRWWCPTPTPRTSPIGSGPASPTLARSAGRS